MASSGPAVLRKVTEWLSHAEEDLRWAQHGFTLTGGSPYPLIAYHAQQSAEKCLKAFLVLKGVDFPYTHNLAYLLELCAVHASWADSLKDAQELTPFAIEARYPGVQDEVTESDARRAVEIALHVRDVVKRGLTDEGLPS